MAWTPIYIDESDLKLVVEWLNNEEEIAFILGDGPKKWIAKEKVDHLDHGGYALWHMPSGPLLLLGATKDEPDTFIDNPFLGWTEKRTGANSWIPYFGHTFAGVIELLIRLSSSEYKEQECIGLSSFGWTGNYWRLIGHPAPQTTEKWWQRKKRWIKKNAIRIPRSGPIDGPDPEIWAFPSAYSKIKSGMPRAFNPW